MKRIEWLIEADVFNENEQQLTEEINKQKHFFSLTNYSHLDEVDFNTWYKKDDCVVFYGSIGLARKLQRSVPWVPGVYLNEKAFECTSYYPVLGDILVHSNYIILPYGDLMRMKDRIFEIFNPRIFIRPNSGLKEFTGMVLEKETYDEGIKLAGFYGIEPNLLIVVSNAWALHKEWRFVVVNGTVITGSAYRDWSLSPLKGEETSDYVLKHSRELKDEFDENNPWDVNAWHAAQRCADKYNPDRCWTIDVTRTAAGTYAILEIGSFSCAGLYGANLEKVVRAVSAAALDEWKEFNE